MNFNSLDIRRHNSKANLKPNPNMTSPLSNQSPKFCLTQ
ncbi:uncharacterized protein G2W53_036416 [Senna tora]|uniref:Uncharacterized protein n=1 Tax=Senna tora TaxID=362788 RepID=A0A834W602_9FABA|nr:uncharacterized protein G2W53_036416 [Senna tora]